MAMVQATVKIDEHSKGMGTKYKKTDNPIALTGTIQDSVRDLRRQGVPIGSRSAYRMFDEYKGTVMPDFRAVNSQTDKCDKCHEGKGAMKFLGDQVDTVAAPWLIQHP